ncbi:hypothetical protein HOY82DRAFT_601315 [Tuber indicum]|nr:hypothetical protein HOY82DRAFT_601315 [Tuber indicum]
MPRDYSESSIWTKDETEIIIQWHEDPVNLEKIKKGSGVTKKAVVTEIAALIPTKETVKVGYKYDNLLKSYRAAAKLNSQTGWGLSQQDLNKLLSRCAYYFRLESIFGDRLNIHLPILYDLGQSAIETETVVEKLLGAMSTGQGTESIREDDGLELLGEIGSIESMDVEEGNRIEVEEREGIEIVEDSEREIGGLVEVGRRMRGSDRDQGSGSRGSGSGSIMGGLGRDRRHEAGGGGVIVESDQDQGHIMGEEAGRNEEIILVEEHGNGESTRPSVQSLTQRLGSAIHGLGKRKFLVVLKDDEDREGGVSAIPRRKKAASNALVDAVGVLASAKRDGEEKKFKFLNRHLIQQAELRQQEIDLERVKLELEKEKARADERRTDLLIQQLRSGYQQKKVGGKQKTLVNDQEVDLESLNL